MLKNQNFCFDNQSFFTKTIFINHSTFIYIETDIRLVYHALMMKSHKHEKFYNYVQKMTKSNKIDAKMLFNGLRFKAFSLTFRRV